METIIGLKELRENTETYINEVKKGKSFVVVRKSRPVFKVSPPDEEEMWEAAADFTKIKRGGVGIKELLRRL